MPLHLKGTQNLSSGYQWIPMKVLYSENFTKALTKTSKYKKGEPKARLLKLSY